MNAAWIFEFLILLTWLIPWLILAIVRHQPSWQTGLKESETVLR